MKKNYETPSIEVVAFQYRDQVVAASGRCTVEGNYKFYVDNCDKDDATVERNN